MTIGILQAKQLEPERAEHLREAIIGAQLLTLTDLFQPDGRYVGNETYLTMLPREARRAMKLVAYCEVGARASLFAMLHETYTNQVVAVYDGSITQWAHALLISRWRTRSRVSHA